MDQIIDYAIWWLKQGAKVLPAQPGTKYLCKGFGPNQLQLTDPVQIKQFYACAGYNLAVYLTPGNLYCLDFDDLILHQTWWNTVDTEYLKTYTETSPRGYHYFYRGPLPTSRTIPGVEIKQVVLVAPSRVGSAIYQPQPHISYLLDEDNPILTIANPGLVLNSLLLSDEKPQERPQAKQGDRSRPNDLIAKIKAHNPIYEYASTATKLKRSSADGRWFVGRCPIHEDHKPSFWIDTKQDLWGCHSCGIRGDVINLHAIINNLSLGEAIHDLADKLPQGEK